MEKQEFEKIIEKKVEEFKGELTERAYRKIRELQDWIAKIESGEEVKPFAISGIYSMDYPQEEGIITEVIEGMLEVKAEPCYIKELENSIQGIVPQRRREYLKIYETRNSRTYLESIQKIIDSGCAQERDTTRKDSTKERLVTDKQYEKLKKELESIVYGP